MRKIAIVLFFLSCVLTSCASTKSPNYFEIRLKGNPTTGYQWVQAKQSEYARLISSDYIPDKNEKGLVGSGGVFVFRFAGLKSGDDTLEFSYLRPWDAEQVAQSKAFAITVDENLNIKSQ